MWPLISPSLQVRDHFLCLSKNTPYRPQEIGRVASSHLVEAEAQVKVDGLVIDQQEKDEHEEDEVLSEGLEEELQADNAEKKGKTEKVKKKKKHSQNKAIVLKEKVGTYLI